MNKSFARKLLEEVRIQVREEILAELHKKIVAPPPVVSRPTPSTRKNPSRRRPSEPWKHATASGYTYCREGPDGKRCGKCKDYHNAQAKKSRDKKAAETLSPLVLTPAEPANHSHPGKVFLDHRWRTPPRETVEAALARGLQVTQCPTL